MTADPFDQVAVTLPDETPLDWMAAAACATTDPDAFFPEKGSSVTGARKVCATCDVQEQCLQYALDTHQEFGYWGGTTRRQRLRMQRELDGAA